MRKLKNEELQRLSVEEFKASTKAPLVLVLDNIRSMNNIGSAFRTADAFKLEKIILTGITAQPPHRDIHKTALGATESVTWEYEKDTTTAIKKLQASSYQVLAIEQADESTLLQDFEPREKTGYALVFGNEVFGVKEEIIPMVDEVIEIPQFGTKHSLNISVTVGIVVWDLLSKWGISKT